MPTQNTGMYNSNPYNSLMVFFIFLSRTKNCIIQIDKNCVLSRALTLINNNLKYCLDVSPCSPVLSLYMVEVLKVLFNLALESRTEDTEELISICKTLDSVLNHAYEDKDSEYMVVSNVINFLINMDGKMEPTTYITHKISNIQRILDYLLIKLKEFSENKLKNLKVRGLLNTVPSVWGCLWNFKILEHLG